MEIKSKVIGDIESYERRLTNKKERISIEMQIKAAVTEAELKLIQETERMLADIKKELEKSNELSSYPNPKVNIRPRDCKSSGYHPLTGEITNVNVNPKTGRVEIRPMNSTEYIQSQESVRVVTPSMETIKSMPEWEDEVIR